MLIEVSDYTWGPMLIIIFNTIVIQFACLSYIYWLLNLQYDGYLN